jgi:hypothetical protein
MKRPETCAHFPFPKAPEVKEAEVEGKLKTKWYMSGKVGNTMFVTMNHGTPKAWLHKVESEKKPLTSQFEIFGTYVENAGFGFAMASVCAQYTMDKVRHDKKTKAKSAGNSVPASRVASTAASFVQFEVPPDYRWEHCAIKLQDWSPSKFHDDAESCLKITDMRNAKHTNLLCWRCTLEGHPTEKCPHLDACGNPLNDSPLGTAIYLKEKFVLTEPEEQVFHRFLEAMELCSTMHFGTTSGRTR